MTALTKERLTAVIPTRNRPADLAKAVASILTQTRQPDELIIVDQSPDTASRIVVENLFVAVGSIALIYLHDPSISGLVEAKSVGATKAIGGIVCFLEDDVVLERDYVEQIEQGFADNPAMVGCCGIITNPPHRSFIYQLIHDSFHTGIFRDIRQKSWGIPTQQARSLIASDMLSGGMSAWRKEVFVAVPFDLTSGFHMFEDIDFSTRVARHFGQRLFINPSARLEHHWSPINRETLGPSQHRKLRESLTYYRRRRDLPGSALALCWLLVGLLCESVAKTVYSRSLGPLRGYFSGIREGLSR